MLLEWAEKQIGTHEGPNNWNPYAAGADMQRLYGWNVQNQPWCDIFVDAGFVACFGYDLGSAMTYQFAGCAGAACAQSAAYYKIRDAFRTTPEVGDQVFFTVGSTIGHTGIVTHVGMGAIGTIEGNSSDMVARRSYALGDPKIAGYGRPNWALVEKAEIPPSGPPQEPAVPAREWIPMTIRMPELRRGDHGEAVQVAQGLLEARGCTVGWYGLDGDFGAGTEQAVRNYQISRRLSVDGIIGPETWAALLEVHADDD